MRKWGLNMTKAAFYKLAFVLSVCMLFVLAAISFRQMQHVNRLQGEVIHSRNRQIRLEKLCSNIEDAERLQRGYYITGDTLYLQQYVKSRSKTQRSLLQIQKTARHTSAWKKHIIDSLVFNVNRRLAIMDNILKMTQHDPQLLKSRMNDGAAVMARIDNIINRLSAAEIRKLREQEKLHNSKNDFLPYTIGFLVLFSVLVLIISFYKISRDRENLRSLNNRLVILNKNFKYAEELAGIGHWKRNLRTFSIEYSDNMYKLFGLTPGTPITEELIFAHVHPEDRHILSDSMQKIKQEHLPPDIVYRIVRTDGKIRYFKSLGEVVQDGDLIMVGTTCDITAQIENNQNISNQNRELEALVAELASFNHIASHDLQEPLRKIQVFISRIEEDTATSISGKSREYFERIKASAMRMQTLIDDLLLYSETSKADQVFETTDLNNLLRDVQAELTAEAEEKQAIITSGQLPVLPVIPFQIRQLFLNLLGNALKYHREDEPPAIVISCEKIKGKDIDEDIPHPSKTYYRISFRDNGIGFKPEFTKKIFVLFQRLHKKEQYSGTGIGLAICKKIMENHNGFITAESNPGQGAVFHCYFPK